MPTHTPTCLWLRPGSRAHGTTAAASLLGFLTGIALATTGPHLHAVLVSQVWEWQRAQPHTRVPTPIEEEREPRVLWEPEEHPAAPERTSAEPISTEEEATPSVSSDSSASSSFISSIPFISSIVSSPSTSLTSSTSQTSEPAPTSSFPSFGRSLFPVPRVPNWGAMRTPAEWDRPYAALAATDFVAIPGYDPEKLTVPMSSLVNPRNDAELTRKLFYSTRFLGRFDLDAGEYSGSHPGVDLKLALGTPIGAIAGGRVHAVRTDATLGLHLIIEHRRDDDVYYSIYGHLGSTAVREGDAVTPGQFIGTVGMTGNTTAPHLHLQVDRGHGEIAHSAYMPTGTGKAAEEWTVHPIRFIQLHAAAREERQQDQRETRQDDGDSAHRS